MKKLKKLFAVMLSLIMVLAMGITSFADEAAYSLASLCDAENPRGGTLWGFLFSLGNFNILLQRHYIICLFK